MMSLLFIHKKTNMPEKKTAKKKSWREHWNSSWDADKRAKLIELIKRDVTQKTACNYVGLPVSTLHDWLARDPELSEQYHSAEEWMHVITSNAITAGILDKNTEPKDKAKLAMDWKKRRDKRYADKGEYNQNIKGVEVIKIWQKSTEGQ